MTVATEFDYETIMRSAHGNPRTAKDIVETSFRFYWRNRANHIARKRCKSLLLILIQLRARIGNIEMARSF